MDSEQERSRKKIEFERTMRHLREREKYRMEVDRIMRLQKNKEPVWGLDRN